MQTTSSSESSLIPEDIKMMASAAGINPSTINTISNVVNTSNSYRNILSGLYSDVLVFIFVVGFAVMIADILG
jgi:uncharacterized ion transporter superfamily protein YfcC